MAPRETYYSNTPDNPAADVACPVCPAKKGEPCRTPSGLLSMHPHAARKSRAVALAGKACGIDACTRVAGPACKYCGNAMCDAHAASGYSCCSGGAEAPLAGEA